MRKTFLYLILFVSITPLAFTQTDSLSIKNIKKTNHNYKSYVTFENKIFAISDSGQLIIWDLNILDTLSYPNKIKALKINAIALDRNGKIAIGTDMGEIYKINPNNFSDSLFYHGKYPIYSICFNSNNKMFLIVYYAVYDPETKRYWNKFENHASGIIVRSEGLFDLLSKKPKKYFSMPQFTYLDNNDWWWMCSCYGEFGGDVQIFDTRNEEIISNNFDSLDAPNLCPKSIFEDQLGNIFITSGLQHFISSGEIYKITLNRYASMIFDSEDFIDTTSLNNFDEGLFIGPGAYNSTDQSIYFATNKGFYKAKLPENGKISDIEMLFAPPLIWGREPLAIGYAMSIKSLEILPNNSLLFLTSNDGFGVFDGNQLIMLN